MIRSVLLLSALLPLAACSGGETGGNNMSAPNAMAADAAMAGNSAQDNYSSTDTVAKVKALSVNARNGVFMKALRDANLGCQGVKKSMPAPDVAPNAWRVQCVEGRQHLIRVQNNGTVDIVSGPAKS